MTPYQAVQGALQAHDDWTANIAKDFGMPRQSAPSRITAGCLVSWPGSGGEWVALEDAAPDPRGTGRLIFRGRSPDTSGIDRRPRRVVELVPPIDCTVRPGNVDWMSRETLAARNALNPPPRDRSKPAKEQE